jgi:hypothetical protein
VAEGKQMPGSGNFIGAATFHAITAILALWLLAKAFRWM